MSEQPVPVPDQTLNDALLFPPAAQPHVTLSSPPNSASATTAPATNRADAALPQGRLGRFEVYGEIGRGGMGAVLRGRDPALGRELALKVLLTGSQTNPDALRRFHEEAQIGGQLQHPGLVPVYELGADSEGRPFFAMKLVDGQTLAALLKARKTPADNMPRLLTIFEQACSALAYAHARGVIHRDLKPSNIMVGAFGEVQVMDWGLAKVIGRSRTPAAPRPAGTTNSIKLNRNESNASESLDGSVLGTPAYMPPEQARGEIDQLDRRADVFGLGAILCVILTGRPPFIGPSASENVKRSANGDLTEACARLDGCAADAELVRLAKACLAVEPDDRPRDGSEVAAQVAGYRAGVEVRLRQAELERAAAEIRTVEERRRRRVQLALGGAVMLLLALGGGGGWYMARQETERVRHESELVLAIEADLGTLAQAQEERKWDEAERVLERVEGRLALGGDDEIRQRVSRVRDDLMQVRKDQQMVARLHDARLQISAAGNDGFDLDGSRTMFEEAFAWYGADIRQGSPEVVGARVENSRIREELVIALDSWNQVALTKKDAKRLRSIANRADDNKWRRQFREALLQSDYKLMRQLADEANLSELRPAHIILLAHALSRANEPKRALAFLQKGRQRYPSDFWLNNELAFSWQTASPPQTAEAVRYYMVAQALRPDSVVVLNNLGDALRDQGKLEEAEAACREAIRIKPGYRQAHNTLGNVLHAQGKLAEAAAAYREAIRLKSDYYQAHYNLGEVLRDQGKLPEAIDAYYDVIRIQPDFHLAHLSLGNTLFSQGKLPEAVIAYREAIRLKPDNPNAYCQLGQALRQQGDLAAALEAYRRGHELGVKTPGWSLPSAQWLRVAERLAELDRRLPDILDGKAKPANAAENIEFAGVCYYKGRCAAAVGFYASAFAGDKALANDLKKGYRYDAACSAALAVAGHDKDPKPLDEPDRTRLRTQALGWLRDDLAAWGKLLDAGKPEDRTLVERKMRHWQNDSDLTVVRDAAALAKLPEAERAAWQKLWQDVETLLKRAAASK